MKMLAAVCVGLMAPAAWSQVEVDQNPAGISSSFDVDAISFASTTPGKSRLDVFAAIGYEQLSFVKQDDKFAASYEMTLTVYDSTTALVSEKLWKQEVIVPDFEQSVSSSSYSLVRRSIDLSPGRYTLSLICRDLESKITRKVMKQLTIADYTKPGLELSDIMLISRLVQEGDKKTITPSISANIGDISGPLYIFFEAYNGDREDSVTFVSTVFTDKNAEVMKTDSTILLNPRRNQVFLRIEQSALPIGNYKLYVQAFHPSDREQPLAMTSRGFIMRWRDLPRSVSDLDAAIEELVYIAKDNELEHIKEATTPEEKQKRFMEFWKKRDPNPNTIRNERMEEHYARVEYANKHFKHYTEGWRTDMGMVYIIFGSPSNVDRHPFDSDSKPYEIWSYYNLNYSFVFVDQTGFGDYRLTTPIWDVLQRARN